MKSGKCPKCGSKDIYCSDKPLPGDGHILAVKHGMFIDKNALLIHYVCGACNLIESYVADKESMQNIRDAWIPLNPQNSKRKNDE